jgi:hypothetical protein
MQSAEPNAKREVQKSKFGAAGGWTFGPTATR